MLKQEILLTPPYASGTKTYISAYTVYYLCLLFSDSTHPGHDVIMKTVDKVHEFYPQQTHSVNLLFDGLFAFNVFN